MPASASGLSFYTRVREDFYILGRSHRVEKRVSTIKLRIDIRTEYRAARRSRASATRNFPFRLLLPTFSMYLLFSSSRFPSLPGKSCWFLLAVASLRLLSAWKSGNAVSDVRVYAQVATGASHKLISLFVYDPTFIFGFI